MNDPLGLKHTKSANYSTPGYSDTHQKKVNLQLIPPQNDGTSTNNQLNSQPKYTRHDATIQAGNDGKHDQKVELQAQMAKFVMEIIKEQRKLSAKHRKRRKMRLKAKKAKKVAELIARTTDVGRSPYTSRYYRKKALNVMKYSLASLIGGLGSCFLMNKYCETFGDTNPGALVTSAVFTLVRATNKMFR